MEPEEYDGEYQMHEELSTEFHDPLIRRLHWLIRACVKMLAILMVLVIFLGVIDVCYILYEHLKEPPLLTLSVSDIFEVFGAFMVVLIAIEIFINIRLYLGVQYVTYSPGRGYRADGYCTKGHSSGP